MNKAILVGRLTRDPELRNTNSGAAVVSFTIAVNRTFTSNTGEREADFINCIAFNKQAENLNRYIRKGGLVGVEGRIQSRSYTAQDGSKRYVTEVVCENVQFLEPKGTGSQQQNSFAYDDYSPYDIPNTNRRPNQQPEQRRNPFEDVQNQYDITDDDLPF